MIGSIQLIILCGDNHEANPKLVEWSRRFADIVWSYPRRIGEELNVRRNEVLDSFLSAHRQYALVVDHDMVPDRDTEPVLTAPGDIVSPRAIGRGGGPLFDGDTNIMPACFRVSADALRRIPRPWFNMPSRRAAWETDRYVIALPPSTGA